MGRNGEIERRVGWAVGGFTGGERHRVGMRKKGEEEICRNGKGREIKRGKRGERWRQAERGYDGEGEEVGRYVQKQGQVEGSDERGSRV